jgi:hypothetical protein
MGDTPDRWNATFKPDKEGCMRLISDRRSGREGPDGEVGSEDGGDEGCAHQADLANLAPLDPAVGRLGDADRARDAALRKAGLQAQIAPLLRKLSPETNTSRETSLARTFP